MKILFLMPAKGGQMDGWTRYTNDLAETLSADHEVIFERSFRNPLAYLKNPILLLSDSYKVRQAIYVHKPDVVHVTLEPYVLFFAFMKPVGVKIILTVHGSYSYIPAVVSRIWRPLYKAFYIAALRHTNAIIAVSEYTKGYLLRALKAANIFELSKKISVVHNGINVSLIQFRADALPTEKKTLLTVAPVKRRKGIIESLRAVARYKEAYNGSIEYRIVGSYDFNSTYGKVVADEIAQLGLSNTVTFVGRVSEEKLQQEYASADLFLMLPVVNEPYFEGFGLVYLEANTFGVPVVGSNQGGSAEAIQEGVSGYTADPQAPREAAERIHDILDSHTIERSSARGWAEAHDIKIIAGKVSEIYRQ